MASTDVAQVEREDAARSYIRTDVLDPLSQAVTALLFGVLPVAIVVAVLGVGLVQGPFRLYDFNGGLYGAGKDVLHGRDPYRTERLQRLADIKRAGGKPETIISIPVYPAPAVVAAVPFSLLPYKVAGTLFFLLSIAALMLALMLLGVSDWRCYGLALGSYPVVHGLILGALTPLLVLGTAVVWRWRDRLWPPAIALAALVSAKLFLWPLGVWLLASRRYRSALLAAVLAVAAGLAAWAVLGFAGLTEYPRMVGNLAFVSEGVSVSFVAALLALGLSTGVAHAVALATAAVMLAAVAWFCRTPAGHRRGFSLAVVAALMATPIVWPHYLALVFVPIALCSKRLSLIWFMPLLGYVAPYAQTDVHRWAIGPYLAVTLLVALAAVRLQPVAVERT